MDNGQFQKYIKIDAAYIAFFLSSPLSKPGTWLPTVLGSSKDEWRSAEEFFSKRHLKCCFFFHVSLNPHWLKWNYLGHFIRLCITPCGATKGSIQLLSHTMQTLPKTDFNMQNPVQILTFCVFINTFLSKCLLVSKHNLDKVIKFNQESKWQQFGHLMRILN